MFGRKRLPRNVLLQAVEKSPGLVQIRGQCDPLDLAKIICNLMQQACDMADETDRRIVIASVLKQLGRISETMDGFDIEVRLADGTEGEADAETTQGSGGIAHG